MMVGEEHFDCLVIGAGISGLDAAYHLQKHASWASYAILERRSNLGGTWDFFKYPGIRSDSDMFTFGFSWKIWRSAEPIATGADGQDQVQHGHRLGHLELGGQQVAPGDQVGAKVQLRCVVRLHWLLLL